MKIVEYFRLNDIRLSDICAGGRHCLAISAPNPYLSKYEELSNRNLFVWGFNFYYQLGLGFDKREDVFEP